METEVLREYRGFLIEKKLKPISIANYISCVNTFCGYLRCKNIKLPEVTSECVKKYFNYKKSPLNTVNRNIGILNSFFGYLFSKKIISQNPILGLKKLSNVPINYTRLCMRMI